MRAANPLDRVQMAEGAAHAATGRLRVAEPSPQRAAPRRFGRWTDAALAAGLLALMVEWILPLPEISHTGGVPLFVALLAAWTAVRAVGRGRIALLLHLGVTLTAFPLFFGYAPWPLGWMGEWAARMLADAPKVAAGAWLFLDPMTRTAGFCLFLWAVSGLAYREAVVRRRPLGVVVGTVAYLAALDTFTPFAGRWAVIRAVAVGLLLLAAATRMRLQEAGGLRMLATGGAWRWWRGAIAVLVGCVTVAALGPVFPPAWPDPLAHVPGLRPKAVQRIGYAADDRVLGGPLLLDDTVVFTARTSGRHYWRGEAKEVYTGRGWESRQEDAQQSVVSTDEPVLPAPLLQWTGRARVVAQAVRFADDAPPAVRRLVFYGGTLADLRVAKDGDRIAGYTATAVLGEVEVAALRRAPLKTEGMAPYLQLPASLPQRVRDVARELTAPYANPYDKVMAIVRHLRSGTYRYETDDVPVPGPGQDFVDHFLFEIRRGYCDHFSTALVVLARAAGIPARWVKGFAPPREQREDGESEVVVRNRHAHSWAEVYFEGVGWVPFEPTPAFLNPVAFREPADELQRPSSTARDPMASPPRPALEDATPDEGAHSGQPDKRGLSEWGIGWPGWGTTGMRTGAGLAALVLTAAACGAFALALSPRLRFRLAARWVAHRARRRPPAEGLRLRFEWLFACWMRRTGAAEGLTVRGFVEAVERRRGAPFPPLRAWAAAYERVRYGGAVPDAQERAELESLWTRLIERWPRG